MRRLIAVTIAGAVLYVSPAIATDSSVPFIYADLVHAMGITGYGVTVAMIDTGIYYDQHGLLGSIRSGGISYEVGQPYYDGGSDIYGYGHGSYMSAIITDTTGVAPDADILPIRVFGPYGAMVDDVVLGIDYARQRRQQSDSSIRVINLSLGGGAYPCACNNSDQYTAAYSNALSQSLAAGIVSFAATGNDACCGSIVAPACVSPTMAVAACYDYNYGITYFDDMLCDWECGDSSRPYYITCFSNWVEECTALSAPGFEIDVDGFWGDGTSQATAHCAGVAALMFERGGCPLSAYHVRDIMYDTADDTWFAYPYCPLPPPPRCVDAYAAVLDVNQWCQGDIDGDGDIDLADLSALLANYGATVPACTGGDLDGDGDVDLSDMAALLAVYNTTCA